MKNRKIWVLLLVLAVSVIGIIACFVAYYRTASISGDNHEIKCHCRQIEGELNREVIDQFI